MLQAGRSQAGLSYVALMMRLRLRLPAGTTTTLELDAGTPYNELLREVAKAMFTDTTAAPEPGVNKVGMPPTALNEAPNPNPNPNPNLITRPMHHSNRNCAKRISVSDQIWHVPCAWHERGT